MAHSKSKKYDVELDHAIIKTLNGGDLGYRDLFNVIKAHVNSFDTFNRHINHLTDSGLIKKNTKHAPFHLTEECRQRLRLKALNLVSPTLDESSSSTRLANRQINMYILVLLCKLGTNYEFERMEELENFLFTLGLSIKSFVARTVTADMEVWESNDGKMSITKRRYLLSPPQKCHYFQLWR